MPEKHIINFWGADFFWCDLDLKVQVIALARNSSQKPHPSEGMGCMSHN